MSGWIKLRKTLITDDIRVQRVARKLGVHRLQVVGMLARLWILADDQFGGGDGDGVLRESADEIDEIVECPGFCAALPLDWMLFQPDGVAYLPDYLEHNGSTAKRRAMDAKRKQKKRSETTPKKPRGRPRKKNMSASDADRMRTGCGQDADILRTRGEERREEDIIASAPLSPLPENDSNSPSIACPERLPPQSGLTEKPTEKSEQRAAAAPISIPLRDGSMWSPAAVDLAAWQAAYPTLDVPAELARLAVWSVANPAKRKTPRGIARCCNSWLSRASERKSSPASPVSRPSGLSFGERLRAKAEEMYGKPPESP